MESTLARAAESIHGQLRGEDRKFFGVSTDTRTLNSGELYFALQGPNFDGAQFVDMAADRQAAGAVVAESIEAALPTIVVDDTRIALGELAADWRQKMPATVIGITGSNGKTTLKELLASCLSLSAETLATRGNLNNEIGMPLMLLELSKEHHYAVIEMGANHAGEIAYLTSLAEPDIVAITNAGPAHLEGFGSLDGVAAAKGEILANPIRPQAAILNADDTYFSYWRSLVPDVRVISFGLAPEADVRASDVETNENGSLFTLHIGPVEARVKLPLQGAHNVINACIAAGVASALDIDIAQIKKGLESVQPVAGRLEPKKCALGASLYDDSYNANPSSVEAAAKFLAALPGDSFLVLGDMAELGAEAVRHHKLVGTAIKASGVTYLAATGELSRYTVAAFGEGAEWFATHEELISHLQETLRESSNVLVKGSRSMGMERVVNALCERSAKVEGL